jgi:molybdopterin-guanine dinucleotide biosynthesis protein A
MRDLAGVVLCGGAGRRMGTDKTRLEIDGRPLVALVAERLATVADPVLIAGADRALPALPFARIDDARPNAGPLGGIVAALRAIDASLLAVVAADMPYVDPKVLSLLADVWDGDDVVVPVDDHGRQPLHAVYARSARAPLESALDQGDLSLRNALQRLSVREVAKEEWSEVSPKSRFGVNLNEPSDLHELG